VPAPGKIRAAERDLKQATVALLNEELPRHLEQLEFNRALEAIWQVVQIANQYVDKTAPWTLAKNESDADQLRTVLYHMAETLRCLSLAAYPFIPKSSQSIRTQLGISTDFTSPLMKSKIEWGGLEAGTAIHKGTSLFPRIESKPQGAKTVSDATTPPQPTAAIPAPTTAAPQITAPAAPAPTAPDQITIDEFMKIQLKTAKVLTAERVPKSEKLLKLQVSLGEGTEPRQIVAGIGKKYTPEALIGKTIIIVANLKPAKLMGIESQGMVLAAGDSEVSGLATILEEVDPGTKVK
jgi:methionyl-tRNA synthetase